MDLESTTIPEETQILSADRYSVLSRFCINNKKYFVEIPNYPNNTSGTCMSVAAHILLSYNNWSNDGRIIPANTATEKFLQYDENTTTEAEIIAMRSNPYDSRLMMATYEHNENDTITTFYEKLLEYIDPNESGATVAELVNGTNRYLNDYAESIKAQITINYSTNANTAKTQIINEIDADRPVIGLLDIYRKEDNAVYGHAIIAFGYQTILCDRTQLQGIIANCGWNSAGTNNAWLNLDWMKGYISFQTNHTHSDYIQNENDSHVVACSICKRIGYNENHTYNIIKQIYGEPYNRDVYHMVNCTCGAESAAYHKLYYEMDSYLEHIKKCSEPKCNYESRESHFFKNGYCFQCRLEDLWGGEYENE